MSHTESHTEQPRQDDERLRVARLEMWRTGEIADAAQRAFDSALETQLPGESREDRIDRIDGLLDAVNCACTVASQADRKFKKARADEKWANAHVGG